MNRTLSWCVLIVSTALVLVLSAFRPSILSDSNGFLKEFIGGEILAVLGVILAITLASAGQLHLTFNQIEERYKKRGLEKTRSTVKAGAYALIWLFMATAALVTVKPLVASEPWSETLFNGAAIIIVIWNVLILVALTQTIFSVDADIPD